MRAEQENDLPITRASYPQPSIVYIHGGGFTGGSKEDTSDNALGYAKAEPPDDHSTEAFIPALRHASVSTEVHSVPDHEVQAVPEEIPVV